MNAEETLDVARSARAGDRELTRAEFDAIRAALNDPTTDIETRALLDANSTALSLQSETRRERKRVEDELERGRARQRKLDERDRLWEELNPALVPLFKAAGDEPHNPTIRLLLKYLQQTERGPAPRSFMPELLSEFDRTGF